MNFYPEKMGNIHFYYKFKGDNQGNKKIDQKIRKKLKKEAKKKELQEITIGLKEKAKLESKISSNDENQEKEARESLMNKNQKITKKKKYLIKPKKRIFFIRKDINQNYS